MSLKAFVKTQILKLNFNKNRKKNIFDENHSELYKLNADAEKGCNNSYYFSGHSQNGQNIIIRLGERGQANSETWFAYSDLNGANYICAHQDAEKDQTMIAVSCIEPGKRWKIQYSGGITPGTITPQNIWRNPKGIRVIPTVFEGEFTASMPIFDFSTHMDSKGFVSAIAHEKWSKKFFEQFSQNNQVYYEQQGRLKGVLNLSGKKTEIDMFSFRNHSFGKRDWNSMDRHIRLCALTENDQLLSINMVGNTLIKELQSGYIAYKDKTNCLDSCTSMKTIGIDGNIPNKFDIMAKFVDGRKTVIRCEKQSVFEFLLDNGNYTIFEGIARFDINGTKAYGIIEFGYNADSSRWLR
jgi:hypothetical protein